MRSNMGQFLHFCAALLALSVNTTLHNLPLEIRQVCDPICTGANLRKDPASDDAHLPSQVGFPIFI